MEQSNRLPDGRLVLCGASAYTESYFFNKDFAKLPQSVQEELRIISILFTQDAGGTFYLVFDEEGDLEIVTDSDEDDITYDHVTAGLLAGKVRRERQEMLNDISTYYKLALM